MDKPELTAEQKKTEMDLWFIACITLAVFFYHAQAAKIRFGKGAEAGN